MAKNSKNIFLVGAGLIAVALVAFVVGTTPSTEAATFLIRGDVTRYDKTNGTVHVYIRHTNSAAEHFAGEVHEINVKNADFYKYDSKQRKVRSTFGTTLDNSGYEVVLRGSVDDSNSFKANWLVRNDSTVKLRGYVRGHDVANNYLTVELDTVQFQKTGKAYRATTFPATTSIRVYYDQDSTKFRSRDNNAMNEDEISNNDEKVTIDNIEVKYGSRFEADVKSTIRDGKWTF